MQKYKNTIPVLVLLLLSFYSLFNTIIITDLIESTKYEIILIPKYYYGNALLFLNILCYVFQKKYYKYLLISTLLLGLINIISFTNFMIDGSISVNSLEIKFQPLSFLILMLIYFLNFKKCNKIVSKRIFEVIKRDIEDFKQEELNFFLNKFYKYPNESLEEIISSEKYVKEAKMAAKQILEKKK